MFHTPIPALRFHCANFHLAAHPSLSTRAYLAAVAPEPWGLSFDTLYYCTLSPRHVLPGVCARHPPRARRYDYLCWTYNSYALIIRTVCIVKRHAVFTANHLGSSYPLLLIASQTNSILSLPGSVSWPNSVHTILTGLCFPIQLHVVLTGFRFSDKLYTVFTGLCFAVQLTYCLYMLPWTNSILSLHDCTRVHCD